MKRFTLLIPVIFLFLSFQSCEKNFKTVVLSDYIAENETLEFAQLIACAGGKSGGLGDLGELPTSVLYYPIEGATDIRYFETNNLADSLDFSKYTQKFLKDDPIFNGYLRKYNNPGFIGERVGIVTFITEGNLHISDPIRIKTNPKPTEVNANLLSVNEIGVNPEFVWEDGDIKENVIYFQVITDLNDNVVSATYTFDKNFTFYDLDNVVLNITDPNTTPLLQPNTSYKITLMGVSEDNWVNSLSERIFQTN